MTKVICDSGRRSPRVDAMGTGWPMEEHVAFRLAGQAVIARELGVSVSSVATTDKGTFSGRLELATLDSSDLGPVLQTELEWCERDTPERTFEELRPSTEAIVAHMLIGLSGEAAERYFCGGVFCQTGRSNNTHLGRLFRLHPCNRPTMKNTAAMLVQCHRDAILRLACHLVVPTKLDDEELDKAINGPDF